MTRKGIWLDGDIDDFARDFEGRVGEVLAEMRHDPTLETPTLARYVAEELTKQLVEYSEDESDCMGCLGEYDEYEDDDEWRYEQHYEDPNR